MINRNAFERIIQAARREAQAASVTVADRTRGCAAETRSTDAGAADTNGWQPYGILGVTALNSFRLKPGA